MCKSRKIAIKSKNLIKNRILYIGMNIPVYYVTYSEVGAISLVEHPAIETDFQTFSKQEVVKFSLDEDKHIAFGPTMIPDLPIYRLTKEGTPYYMVFTKESIAQMVEQAAKADHLSFNLEHSVDKQNSIYLLESFVSREDLRPSSYEDLPIGTWYVSLKVEDENIWQDIKNGKFNGFSIEALVDIEPELKADPLDEEINNILD